MNTQTDADLIDARKHWMAVLARAPEDQLDRELHRVGVPQFRFLRPPETGLTMVRGRTGGTGQPFNLGETTMTRCVVELDSGHRGFGYVLGRSHRHAELAALLDALIQVTPDLQDTVIAPLHEQWRAERDLEARTAAATRVDFMTMVRGE